MKRSPRVYIAEEDSQPRKTLFTSLSRAVLFASSAASAEKRPAKQPKAIRLECRWENASTGSFVAQDGRAVRCFKEPMDDKYAACVASALPISGVIELSVSIVKSGAIGVLVGVAENRESFPSANVDWPRAWGLAGWSGRLITVADGRSRKEVQYGNELMRGDLRGTAGRTVQMRVDMDRRFLYYKVNTPEWMCATDSEGRPIKLSANVRPFVRFSEVGDAVALGAIVHAPSPSVSAASSSPFPSEGCVECERHREKETALRDEVDRLRAELDKVRHHWEAEQMLRVEAERQRDHAIQRSEQLLRSTGAQRMSAAERVSQAARARELKHTLLFEAHAANETVRESMYAADGDAPPSLYSASPVFTSPYARRWGVGKSGQG